MNVGKFDQVCWLVLVPLIVTVTAYVVQALPKGSSEEPKPEYYETANFHSVLEDGCVADCESEIYCHGEILHDIQLARIYPDSKTFVDKKLLYSEEEIVIKYRKLKQQTNNKPTVDQLKTFIDENFEDDVFDPWVPSDLKETPSIVHRIPDEPFRRWILDLNQIWKDLAQKLSDDVRTNPKRHSYLYVPYGFIKAGGRFRELYYWDTYWVIKGLLLCDMFDTARDIIANIIWLVKHYGHMPNGNRVYYTKRSQPPLLIQMAVAYQSFTKDDKFIEDNLQYFDMEFHYWYDNRMVEVEKDGMTFRLARYNAVSCTPRPESYYEDYTLAAKVTNKTQRMNLFTAIKSAAESAWDFSSRHFRAKDGSNKGTLLDMDTQNLLFVDLNCILHANAMALSEWYASFGNDSKSLYFKNIADELLLAIEKVFWNEEIGVWLDYDPGLKKHRKYFYATNLTPLWTGSYRASKKLHYVEKVIGYLRTQGMIKFDLTPTYFGVPASKECTREQWDFPNCWPPLQAFIIQGLERTGHPTARYIAFKMAENWIRTMYVGFIEHGYMFEKYCATEIGTTGSGGEYVPQRGFGWTNGFCMELFDKWGEHFKSDNIENTQLLSDE